MTDKTSSAGWVVQVTAAPATPGADHPAFKYYNVAIDDAAKAVAAVEAAAKHKGAPKDVRVDPIRKLSLREIASIPLKAGEVKPA